MLNHEKLHYTQWHYVQSKYIQGVGINPFKIKSGLAWITYEIKPAMSVTEREAYMPF